MTSLSSLDRTIYYFYYMAKFHLNENSGWVTLKKIQICVVAWNLCTWNNSSREIIIIKLSLKREDHDSAAVFVWDCNGSVTFNWNIILTQKTIRLYYIERSATGKSGYVWIKRPVNCFDFFCWYIHISPNPIDQPQGVIVQNRLGDAAIELPPNTYC